MATLHEHVLFPLKYSNFLFCAESVYPSPCETGDVVLLAGSSLETTSNKRNLSLDLLLLLLSTHYHDPCSWGESDLPACGPQASFSVHLASSEVTSAGSVHKSRVVTERA